MKALVLTAVFLLAATFAHAAEELPTLDAAAIDALRAGGHVIVMRHTSSPRDLPDAASANDDNASGERQLDETGRRDAEALGAALRKLDIPVASVETSPTYRAQETARVAGFDEFVMRDELGNEGMREASEKYAQWLRERIAQAPGAGNALLITHGPNIAAAFPEHASGMGEGDALVFATGNPEPVARIAIAEWPAL